METVRLTLQHTPLSVIVGIAMVAITAILSWIAWKRSGFARGTGLMELLRLAIVTMVAITFNQPEWLEEFLPDEAPTLAVLWDTSRSMETQDVIDESKPAEAPKSRKEWIEPLTKKERWKALSDKLDIVIQSYSSGIEDADAGTDINAALESISKKHANLRGVVLIGDGDWNLGDAPSRAASRLRLKDVPVFGLGAGAQARLPDIELVRVDAPSQGVAKKPMRIPIVVDSALPQDTPVTITMTPSIGDPVTIEGVIPSMGRLEENIIWTPENVGDYELTVDVPVQQGELIAENNKRTVPIKVGEEALKVLLIESFPRWEYRYLRNALERDPGVEVSALLFHPGLTKVGGGRGYLKEFPATFEELQKYSVIFIGDVGVGDGQLTLEQCRRIKGIVESQASGLIFMPGMRGAHLTLAASELDEIYPVVLDAGQPRGWGSRIPSQFELTETGRRSLLTKLEDNEDENARTWETLPGFQWYSAALRAKAGTEVLATHKTESTRFGRVPLLVTRTFGTGKVLYMGTDAAWRWREGVEDKYHYRFWGQVARWMAYQRSIASSDMMRLFFSPDRPQSGELVTLNANVMSQTGEPMQSGNVMVTAMAPSGKTETIRLTPTGSEWGLFSGNFTPEENGRYDLTLTCRENGATLQAKLPVQGIAREKLGQPARFDVLEEVATITRGRMVEASEIDELIDEIAQLPEPEPLVRRLRVWANPIWAGTIILLMALFWTGRKMIGMI